jgi:hypothetical protein
LARSTHVFAKNHVVHQVDDLSHCCVGAALAFRRPSELNGFAIAEKASGKQEVIQVCRGRLQIEGIHYCTLGAESGSEQAVGCGYALLLFLMLPKGEWSFSLTH